MLGPQEMLFALVPMLAGLFSLVILIIVILLFSRLVRAVEKIAERQHS